MKRKIFSAIVVVFFIVTLCFSVYMSSKDNFSNKSNGYDNKIISLDDIEMLNWTGKDGDYLAGDEAQMLLDNVDCFVHTVKISGQIVPSVEYIKIYYIQNAEDSFTEEMSKEVPCRVNGDNVYLTVDVPAAAIRIDLKGNAGAELLFDSIEINDMSPVISINNIAKFCLLPTIVLGGLLFLLTYCINVVQHLRGMKKYLPLVGNLISRDLKVKYRRSVLGFLWSILNPLLMALVTNAVFAKIFRFQVEYFASYYLTGVLIFNFIVECTTGSLSSIINAAPLIKKVYIPKYVFPLQKCVFAFVNMLFGSVAVVVVMLIQGVPFHTSALLFFIPMFYAFVFAYGFGLVLAAFTVYFRDIQHLYSVFTSVWLYLTPIIYPEEMLLSNRLGIVMKLNPMYYFVHSFRSLLLYGELPTLNENIMCIVFALLSLVCGLTIFRKLQDRFILYI